MLIDTHCHLDLPWLGNHPETYLAAAGAAGVERWVVPGLHPDGWQGIADLCRRYDGTFPAFGIHPRHAGEVSEEALVSLRQWAGKGVAVGEIGLDRRCAHPERQQELFRRQIRIACELELPLLIHCNGMVGMTLAVLREERAERVGGILHGYCGSLESAREFVQMGFVLSPGGNLLRQNTDRPRRLLQSLGLSRLVLESDAPGPAADSPRNRPEFLTELVDCIATMTGYSPGEIIRETGRAALEILPCLGREHR